MLRIPYEFDSIKLNVSELQEKARSGLFVHIVLINHT